jgi:mycoredoxin
VASSEATGASQPNVVMYCRSWCGDCMRAKRWLESNGVEYTEIDIEARPDTAAVVREIAGKIVTPTFVIGEGQTCVDFDPERLKMLLGME